MPEAARTAFAQFEGAVAGYLHAADDFADIFLRRGRKAFTSEPAQQEIHLRGRRVSAAYHELSDNGPRYLRDLQMALPLKTALHQDAQDLQSFVLRAVHVDGVRSLNNVIDLINDAKKTIRPKVIDEQMARVATTVQDIQKQGAIATQQLNNLRRAFGTAVVSLETSHK